MAQGLSSSIFTMELAGTVHGKSLTKHLKPENKKSSFKFSVTGQDIFQAITDRVADIKKQLKQVGSLSSIDKLTLTAIVKVHHGIRFAVEFTINELKQLRNTKQLSSFILKSNAEIKRVFVQACFNFDTDFDTIST